MSSTIEIGLVDTDELTRVFDSLWTMRMEGKRTPGVIVFCQGGRRCWHISSEDLSILITGDAADFTGAYRLPLTIVANAGRQGAANGPVTYTIKGDVVTAESARGRQSVSCTSVLVPGFPKTLGMTSQVSATLSGKDLIWVAFSGANDPFESGMFDDDDDRQTPDHFTITISDGLLMVSSDWTPAKLYPMLGGTSAMTHGAGEIRVNKSFLPVLINCVDTDSEWTIAFNHDDPHTVVLESASTYIVANMGKVPVEEAHSKVRDILDRENFEYQVASDGSIGVRFDGVIISLNFFGREDNEAMLLGISTVVVRHANESAELLREINAHNRVSSVTRCWFDSGNVHLGLELLPDSLHVLASRLRHLANDAKRLTGLLEPFAAETPIATPKRRRRSKKSEQRSETWD